MNIDLSNQESVRIGLNSLKMRIISPSTLDFITHMYDKAFVEFAIKEVKLVKCGKNREGMDLYKYRD